jgi:hypothetical protein
MPPAKQPSSGKQPLAGNQRSLSFASQDDANRAAAVLQEQGFTQSADPENPGRTIWQTIAEKQPR